MGQNLILNMADNGFTVIAFNRTVSKVDRFVENEAKGKSVIGVHSIEEFVQKLKKPRRMMMLVQAGKAVDDFIELIITSSSMPPRLLLQLANLRPRGRSRAGRHHN
jgi:6-phosphogluconate dehydrogenase